MFKLFSFAVVISSLLIACSTQPISPAVVPIAEQEAIEIENRTLTICLGNEPETLYPLAAASRSAWSVLEAIYDGPVDIINGQPQPVILTSLPSRENGGISLTPVQVKTGDLVADTRGNLTSLAPGVRVFPSGCSSPDCAITWDGITPLTLDQLSARFTLKPGITWSDGAPLTADDALFSSEIASDPATPGRKNLAEQTAAYTVIDSQTLLWQGLPGLMVADVSPYFPLPLPRHAWGELSAADLLSAALSSREPIGWGGYVLAEWKAGESIRLVKNPRYFRAAEGLPKFEYLVFNFMNSTQGDTLAAVKDGICDVVLPEAIGLDEVTQMAAGTVESSLKIIRKPGNAITFLASGIKPAAYDDSYYPYGTDRPDLFGDVRTRQAITQCINRQAIIVDLLQGEAEIPVYFVSPDNALGLPQNAALPYDAQAGMALLEQAGWRDFDQNNESARTALNVKNMPDWRKLELTLISTTSALDTQIAQRVQADLAECGIPVSITALPVEEAYMAGPEGAVFGRRFDLALLSMRVSEGAPCGLITSDEIPMQSNYWMGALRGGNFTGFSNARVDAACAMIAEAGSRSDVAKSAAAEVLRVIAQELPFIPLFYQPVYSVMRADMCAIEGAIEGRSSLPQLEQFDYGATCQQ